MRMTDGANVKVLLLERLKKKMVLLYVDVEMSLTTMDRDLWPHLCIISDRDTNISRAAS